MTAIRPPDPKLMGAAGLALAVLGLLFAWPARGAAMNIPSMTSPPSPDSPPENIPYPERSLSTQQRLMVEIITRGFRVAGWSDDVVRAAVANAWHESAGLNPRAAGDGGRSLGLFQLASFGAGREIALPMVNGAPDPADPRFDPTQNTRRIVQEANAYGARGARHPWMVQTGPDQYGERGAVLATITGVRNLPLRELEDLGADVGELAAAFSRDVERPAARQAEMIRRRDLARSLYPSSRVA